MIKGLIPVVVLCALAWIFWMSAIWLTKKKSNKKDKDV